MTRWKGIAIALVITMLTGCGVRAENDKHSVKESSDATTETSTVRAGGEKVELTERQKQILELEGLPTDYYELEGQQQDAITRIELCLDYLDRTYPDDTFTYLSYEGYAFMSGRSPKVYAVSEKIGEDRYVSVGVKNYDGQYQFYDDYKMVMDSNVYQAEIEKYIRSQLPDTEFFVNAKIDQYIEGDSYIMERASGYFTVVMNDAFENEDELKKFLYSLADWENSYNKEMSKSMLCIVFFPKDYKDANLLNYNDLSKERKEKYRARCMVNSGGEVRVVTF